MERNGWPERFNLFPRLRKVAKFLGAPAIQASHSPHFRGANEMLERVQPTPVYCPDFVEDELMERQIGHEVMNGQLDATKGLKTLSDVHRANLEAIDWETPAGERGVLS